MVVTSTEAMSLLRAGKAKLVKVIHEQEVDNVQTV